ncbi:hypothetical protein [Actinomadura decatromicini]|uniref:Uncharacterized protein n=1 Tax=Actinomadura decatromicini TaxID=2604572 RepID=A0A5D3FDD0_9ACTN|nr:hypothetical protein [Actinomadura decatromicini]TYK46907.1 hypothetical protein FXF68_24065 [Actinomadura decatromicini]
MPRHLQVALTHWLRRAFTQTEDYTDEWDYPLMMVIASSAELSLPPDVEAKTSGSKSTYNTEFFDAFVQECRNNEEKFLDAIDATLRFSRNAQANKELEQILQAGGSSWRVSDDETSLQLRVEASAQRAADEAMQPADLASDELRSAWVAAYGRTPNASDAWDHSIKAVEAVLVPIVSPKAAQTGRLGQAIGQLRKQGHLYRLTVPFGDGSQDVGIIVAMLDKLYSNPDRHANGIRRVPGLTEAQALLHLAITIVQWLRQGILVRI